MNVKKLVSSVAAFAMTASVFAGLAVTASAAEPVTVLEEAFATAGTLTGGEAYTWSSDAASMVVSSTYKSGKVNVNTTGLYLTNNNATSGNYNNKKIVTFNSPIGDSTHLVDVSYTVLPKEDKGQATTYFTVGFYNATDELVFSIKEGNGPSYGFSETLTYADSSTTTADVSLSNTVSKGVAKDRNASISFNSTGGNLTVDGNTYSFKTTSAGISYMAVSVSGGQDYSRGTYVNNLKITTTESTEQKAIVTVNSYDRADNALIRTTTLEEVVGNTYTATEAQTATFTASNNKKYAYNAAASTASAVVGESGATISLYFDEVAKYNCAVKAIGDITKDISSKSVYEGDTFNYTYPQYIVEDGVAYEAAKNTAQNTYYGGSIENITEARNAEIKYTKAYENVVLYDELDGSDDKAAGTRASNCSAYNNAPYTSASIEPGVYDVYVRYANVGRGSTMTIGDQAIISATDDCTKNSWTTQKIEGLTVSEAAPLVWNAGGGGAYDPIDTILIVKVPQYAPVTVTEVTTSTEFVKDNPVRGWRATANQTADNKLANTLTWKITVDGTAYDVVHNQGPTISGPMEIVAGLIIQDTAENLAKVTDVKASLSYVSAE